MPVYEYKCKICGRTKEKLQSITNVTPPKCNHCKRHMTKQISSSTFVFAPGAKKI